MPVPGRALAAAAVSCQGRTILFDCGEGTQLALRRHHVSAARIDFIALTHYHGDHIFGLPGLLQTIGCLGRERPLYLAGPEGLVQAMTPILQLAGPMPCEIRGLDLSKGDAALSELAEGWPVGAVLSAIPTVHRVSSQGYQLALRRAGKFLPEKAKALGVPVQDWSRLQKGETVSGITPDRVLGPARTGLSVVFSGDTRPCEAVEQAAKDADLLIHEATYADEADREAAERWGHSTFAGAAALAQRAGAKRLWLTHFSQTIADPEAALPAAQAQFPAAECPAEGQRLSLAFPPD